MKKQNVKLILLASLVTGLLSQGAMAATQGSTVKFHASVQDTTCNVSALNGTAGAASPVDFGYLSVADIAAGTPAQPVGTGSYNLLASTVTPVMLTVKGCSGTELLLGKGLELSVNGAGANSPAGDKASANLYGDATTDHGFGFALGYSRTDNSTGNAKSNNGVADGTGFILPSSGTLPLYKATAASNPGDLALMDVSVVITPQIASWGTAQEGKLTVPVTFNVAMN